MDKNCFTLKESLSVLFANELEVSAIETGCIVTLPVRTVDDRYIDVFVEPVPNSDFVYVHDGGKNTAELFAQGIHSTEGQETLLTGIARRHGAYFQNGRFQIACPNEAAVHNAIFAISQCAALAMVEVVSHEPKIEDESLTGRVARTLHAWQPSYVEIHKRYWIKGKTGVDQLFDFVSMPVKGGAHTVAVKLLPPSVGPAWQVSRYGFLALDIEGQPESRWPRLAIISKADEWSSKQVDVIRSLSREVILLDSDHEDQLDLILPRRMTELTEAA